MFTYYEYRKKALRYGELAKTAPAAKQESEFRALEERFMRLADNEEWLSRNHGKNVSAADTDQLRSSPSPSKRNTSCGVLARR
jgi:hypothetical protein